jgi:hypothetical protein
MQSRTHLQKFTHLFAFSTAFSEISGPSKRVGEVRLGVAAVMLTAAAACCEVVDSNARPLRRQDG